MSDASTRVETIPGAQRRERLVPIKTLAMAPVFDDLGIRADRVRTIGCSPSARTDTAHALVGVPSSERDVPDLAREIVSFAERESSLDGMSLVFLEGRHSDAEIASFRNALWPFAHVGALYRVSNSQVLRTTLEKTESLHRGSGLHGTVLVARRREQALAPDATVKKFDKNAAGWNGAPGTPGYAHFRWMRRYVAQFAEAPRAKRILDFGCGAGWVGIEAARVAPGAALAAFDPSPEMVKLAEENARASGIARFEGRTGFGEEPPFPAPNEAAFDLVLSSGVVSFAADRERWLDGLVRTVALGGTLVIGDINRDSIGMRRRRRGKPLLPLREMNACTREEIESALERRGLAVEESSGYQLTRPVPELMHWSEKRVGGILSRPLLWTNRAGCALFGASRPERFDSWVMRLRRT
jgi:SAM-dependent methyltransferase